MFTNEQKQKELCAALDLENADLQQGIEHWRIDFEKRWEIMLRAKLTKEQEEVYLYDWRYCLGHSDRKGVAELLRVAARRNYALPSDIIRKVADMIDPDKPQRLGRKPRSGVNAMRDYIALRAWIFASFDNELARFLVNQDKIAFQLSEGIEYPSNWASDKFAPTWKHPDMCRTRKLTSYPRKGQLKYYICTSYKISERYLDMLIKEEKDRIRTHGFPNWIESPEIGPDPFGWWNP